MRKAAPLEPAGFSWNDSVVETFGMPEFFREMNCAELVLVALFGAFIAMVHLYASKMPMKKEAVLNMAALNRVNVFKECFLGYVNAGMLEPIMAIASSDYDVTVRALFINLAQLVGLFSWLYLLSDAFDISDTQQAFVYWSRIDLKKGDKLPKWLRRGKGKTGKIGIGTESTEIKGSFVRDLALWSMLFCSLAAFCGLVGHRDVIHSHAIVLLWVMLHHQTRKATAWRGTGYWHTLFSPSSALLPLEYCLNLIDQEMVGDDALEDIEKWVDFIKEESGVSIIIEA